MSTSAHITTVAVKSYLAASEKAEAIQAIHAAQARQYQADLTAQAVSTRWR